MLPHTPSPQVTTAVGRSFREVGDVASVQTAYLVKPAFMA